MPINFPANSAIDDVYTYNDVNFIYDGQRWKIRSKPVYVGTTEPLNPYKGDLFFDTSINTLSIFDGTEWQYFNTTQSIVYPETNGEAAYTSPGTYSWICPSDVNFVHAVCVGGGGGNGKYFGGGGGALAWRNDIQVTPGNFYTVVVGDAGVGVTSGKGGDGGASYFIDINTVYAGGGGGGDQLNFSATGGNYSPYGGAGGSTSSTYSSFCTGGGGAGGYSGKGGDGSYSPGDAGSGGSGGAGGGASNTGTGGGGGGVGILGEGNSGTGGGGGTNYGAGSRGGGGSGGVGGSVTPSGGSYGGGAGGNSSSTSTSLASSGAVRIIWGPNRGFPSTNTGVL